MTSRYSREEALKPHYDETLMYYSTDIKKILERIGGMPENTKSILDLGCGDGRACLYLASVLPETTKLVGVDYSNPRIEIARLKTTTSNCKFVRDDIHDFLDACIRHQTKFDLVIANEVLEHLEVPLLVIEKAQQITDCVVGTVPINLPYKAHLHVWKTPADIEQYFKPDRIVRDGGHCILRWDRS
jgi:2-polyprenyl-3-methyl-5-hydroxy-6-metoxy-1,4-benzoquinol methylase